MITINGIARTFIAVTLVLASQVGNTYAQTVRGRLDGNGPYGAYPASRIAVTLISPTHGRSAPAYSDYQGMYYIYNVPPGQFTLEVWTNSNQPLTFNILVPPNPPTMDIAPIQLNSR